MSCEVSTKLATVVLRFATLMGYNSLRLRATSLEQWAEILKSSGIAPAVLHVGQELKLVAADGDIVEATVVETSPCVRGEYDPCATAILLVPPPLSDATPIASSPKIGEPLLNTTDDDPCSVLGDCFIMGSAGVQLVDRVRVINAECFSILSGGTDPSRGLAELSDAYCYAPFETLRRMGLCNGTKISIRGHPLTVFLLSDSFKMNESVFGMELDRLPIAFVSSLCFRNLFWQELSQDSNGRDGESVVASYLCYDLVQSDMLSTAPTVEPEATKMVVAPVTLHEMFVQPFDDALRMYFERCSGSAFVAGDVFRVPLLPPCRSWSRLTKHEERVQRVNMQMHLLHASSLDAVNYADQCVYFVVKAVETAAHAGEAGAVRYVQGKTSLVLEERQHASTLPTFYRRCSSSVMLSATTQLQSFPLLVRGVALHQRIMKEKAEATPAAFLGCTVHVVHGARDNLAVEATGAACELVGVPYTVVDIAASTESDVVRFVNVVVAGLEGMANSTVAILLTGCEKLEESGPVVQWILSSHSRATPVLMFLIVHAADAVPALIGSLSSVSPVRVSVPSDAERRSIIQTVFGNWALPVETLHCCTHSHSLVKPKFYLSSFFDVGAAASWTVGLSTVDLVAWLRYVQVQLCATYGDGNAVLTSSQCEQLLRKFQQAHGHHLTSTRLDPVRWSDVGGLEGPKSEILETIQLPRLHPELFVQGVKRRAGILLYGPPGCGKTLLAKAVATELEMNFLSVKGPELINMYVGESEKNIRELFQRARDSSPCIVFFDELDALAPSRGAKGDSGGVMDRIVAQLLAEVDGVGRVKSSGDAPSDVFIIGATNRPDLLDPSLMRPGRFDRLCYLGIPTKSEQAFAIKALTRKFNLAADVDLKALVEPLEAIYTGADLFALCSDAMMMAAEETINRAVERAKQELEQGAPTAPSERAEGSEEAVVVAMRHFLASRSRLAPSVSQQDLKRYESLQTQFDPSKAK